MKRVLAVYILTFLVTIYDVVIKLSSEIYTVNLSIFFFVSVYGYIVWTIWSKLKPVNVFERKILRRVSLIWIFKGVLNLLSINQSWDVYVMLTSNYILDVVSIIILIIILIQLLCQRYRDLLQLF